MAGIREKQKRVTEQGYAAARQNKIFPRELQNTTNGSWEDAKLYSMNTRQGQNYWQGHMKDYAQAVGKSSREEAVNRDENRRNEQKRRTGFPTRGPMAETPENIRRKKKQNEIVDRLLKK